MNIKIDLLEDYVNFVDTTTKQNTLYSEIHIGFFVFVVSFVSFYLLFKYLNE